MALWMLSILWIMGILVGNIGVLPTIAILSNSSTRPEIVHVGAIFSFDSTVGKVAKVAIQAAVDDVNASGDVLQGIKLRITMQDSKYSGFLGIVDAMTIVESNVVAIIGPQSSVNAHIVSHFTKELQVPLLSFAATDPNLSTLEHPYFVRTTHSDRFEMAAIADIVYYFGWREVTAIYTDDDYGRNGIAALSDKLAQKRCTIGYKAPMNPTLNRDREDITNVLLQVALQQSRVLVLHTYSNYGLEILDVARSLNMLEKGYVWIVTHWLTDIIDTNAPDPIPPSALNNIQGLLTLRVHIPDSHLRRNFTSRWSNLVGKQNPSAPFGLNTNGLHAYDTVWILARALDLFFKRGGNISFSYDSRLSLRKDKYLHLEKLKVFDEGNRLLEDIHQVNITGLTGHLQFDSGGNLINPTFDIINVVGTGYNTIGYWSNYSGLSVQRPEVISSREPNNSSSREELLNVVWPGHTTEKPRGWVFPINGRLLRIGVPNRVDYQEFISYSAGTDTFTGYCIDVFTTAVNLLPYAVPYELIPFGNGKDNPHMTELVENIGRGVFDAAIGDIVITTKRTTMADFTQPYVESGLVVVAPVRPGNCNAWAFFRPFTPSMWGVTVTFFIVVGSVIWTLEHRSNDEFRGPPRQQIETMFWFSISTWFFAQKENTVSTLGRIVLIIWLFVVLIINSNYIASLTSILTVQQLSSTVKGVESLVSGNDRIGYQEGSSYAQSYLHEELNIPQSRLVALRTEDDFAEALKRGPSRGGVAAVVHESAYMELFLSKRCEFTIVGDELTKTGWGFAFPKDSPLATDMSTAILKLAENGELQRIHDKWLTRSACSSLDTTQEVDRLPLRCFWGLYIICAAVCVLALTIHFGLMVRQFMRDCPLDQERQLGRENSTIARVQTFLTFVDGKEEGIIAQSQRRQLERASTRCSTLSFKSNKNINLSMNSSQSSNEESSSYGSNNGSDNDV